VKTVGEAREAVSEFLRATGCYEICAHCPVYPGGVGCCHGCAHLVRNKGCGNQNLSCLTYTCGVLNMHLSRQSSETHGNKLNEFVALVYPLPREGYRGCEKREASELLQISDPLAVAAELDLNERFSQGMVSEEKEVEHV